MVYKPVFLLVVLSISLCCFSGCGYNQYTPGTTMEQSTTDPTTSGSSPVVTVKDPLNAVQVGQSYPEIVAALGCEGVEVGSGFIIYEWQLADGGKLLIHFAANEEMGATSITYLPKE